MVFVTPVVEHSFIHSFIKRERHVAPGGVRGGGGGGGWAGPPALADIYINKIIIIINIIFNSVKCYYSKYKRALAANQKE